MFFLGVLVVSYGAAFVTSLAFEAPMMALEKVVFQRDAKVEPAKVKSVCVYVFFCLFFCFVCVCVFFVCV